MNRMMRLHAQIKKYWMKKRPVWNYFQKKKEKKKPGPCTKIYYAHCFNLRKINVTYFSEKKNKAHVNILLTLFIVIEKQFFESLVVCVVSSYWKASAPSLFSTCHATLFLNLSLWTGSRHKSPFQKQQILHHALYGFPHHLSSTPLF